jgi:predicted dehydrogenase
MGLRIGVVGTGRLGREHVRVFSQLAEVDRVGCYDVRGDAAAAVAAEFGASAYDRLDDLIEAVEAVSVVVPSTRHSEVSIRAIERGRDVFIEKPIADDLAGAERILQAAAEHGRIVQSGHIERFNAAFEAARPHIQEPAFIEVHRLAPFAPRGIDVSVATDLMIHDLDLLLLILGGWPSEIRAKGAGILTPGPDIINARLEFEGGCVANLTSSRVSLEPMRKLRIFSPNQYLSIDLLTGRVKRIGKGAGFGEGIEKLKRHEGGLPSLNLSEFLDIVEYRADGEEPLKKELQAFCRSVQTRQPPPVTGEDGLRALKLVTAVLEVVRTGATAM